VLLLLLTVLGAMVGGREGGGWEEESKGVNWVEGWEGGRGKGGGQGKVHIAAAAAAVQVGGRGEGGFRGVNQGWAESSPSLCGAPAKLGVGRNSSCSKE